MEIEHVNKVRSYENMTLLIVTLCSIFPLIFPFIVCEPIEPSHIIIQELLEIDLSLKITHIPIFLVFMVGISIASTVILTTIALSLVYALLSSSCFRYFTPISLRKSVTGDNSVETKHLGILPMDQVISLYKMGHVLNALVNHVLGCLHVSFHHAVMLVIFVGMSYFLIVGRHIVFSNIALTLVVLIALFISLYVEYQHSVVTDGIVQSTGEFVEESKKLSHRKSLYHKFAQSCPNFLVVEIAYPFYKMSRETFPGFILQAQDSLFTMLSL